ncbi:hypothetical protein [Pelotalea chapellei]|uniref:Uncharacterized protein n=1 Tax=Pelotalea chapellei TaxID=44671 RepID=A0ABS5UAD5_9BACT|nr:hypothetical protein [Pelotalea chapellei]MBT1072593.1 hypothetical protein [Pelotalea chapellei]
MLSANLFLVLAILQMILVGCVGDIDVPQEEKPAVTNLTVIGLEKAQPVEVSYVDITVTDSVSKYHSFQYALDTEKTYSEGSWNMPITLTASSEGNHILYLKGVYSNGQSDAAMSINFTVRTLSKTGSGRYSGDSLVYYSNYSSMKINFVTYSGARNKGNLSGKLWVENAREFNMSGVSIDNQQWPSSVEALLTGTIAPESMRISGEGYYQCLNLKYLGTDLNKGSTSGDIRLYRDDIKKTLVASSNNMHAYNQTGLPDLQSVLTLYTFDNRYFYGHIRLINPSLKKVLSYDVKGDAGANGLVGDNNGIILSLTKPFGYIAKATPAPPQAGTGFVTVVSDAGTLRVNQMSLNLPGYAIYDSIPASISMRKTFPKL